MRNDPEARRPACLRLLVTPSVKGGYGPKVCFGEVPRSNVGASLFCESTKEEFRACDKIATARRPRAR
mgnify:CR=1 FL=1|jgi:hypothetical protein